MLAKIGAIILFTLLYGCESLPVQQDSPKIVTQKRATSPTARTTPGTTGKTKPSTTTVTPPPITVKERASYAQGFQNGEQLASRDNDLNREKFLAGIRDAFAGKKSPLSNEEMRTATMAHYANQRRKRDEKRKALAEKNLRDGAAFLAANQQKAGVITLASGVQYQILHSGTGRTPKVSDSVTVHYHGTLINGDVFDSSVERGQTTNLKVRHLVSGWTEILQKMQVGDRWKVFLPPDQAFGSGGSGAVTPNSTVIYEIELLNIIQ